MPHGLGGIARAAGPLFFSFAGWEAVAPLAQEFPNPDADARAVAISTLVIVTIVYLALAITCVLTLGAGMDADSTPVQSLLALSWRGGAPWVTAGLAAILTYGAMSAYIGGAASMAAALARDGWLPRTLAPGHEAGQTPRRAAAAVGAVGAVAIVTLVLLHVTGVPLGQIMTLASAMFITVTLAGLLAGARLLASPWQRVSALIGGAMVLLVLVGCGSAVAGPLAVAVAVAVACRPLSRRRSSR